MLTRRVQQGLFGLVGLGLLGFACAYFYYVRLPRAMHAVAMQLQAEKQVYGVQLSAPRLFLFPWFGLHFDAVAWQDAHQHYRIRTALDVKWSFDALWSKHPAISGLRLRHAHLHYTRPLGGAAHARDLPAVLVKPFAFLSAHTAVMPGSIVLEDASVVLPARQLGQPWVLDHVYAYLPWRHLHHAKTLEAHFELRHGHDQAHVAVSSLLRRDQHHIVGNNTRLMMQGVWQGLPLHFLFQGDVVLAPKVRQYQISRGTGSWNGLPMHFHAAWQGFFRDMRGHVAFLPVDLGNVLRGLGLKPSEQAVPLHDFQMDIKKSKNKPASIDLHFDQTHAHGVWGASGLDLHVDDITLSGFLPWLAAWRALPLPAKAVDLDQAVGSWAKRMVSVSAGSSAARVHQAQLGQADAWQETLLVPSSVVPNLQVHIDRVHEHDVVWSDMTMALRLDAEGLWAPKIRLKAYEGLLTGQFVLPWAVQAHGQFMLRGDALSVQPLLSFLPFSIGLQGKMTGRLQGHIDLDRHDAAYHILDWSLLGRMVHGQMQGVDPLAWIYSAPADRLGRDWLMQQGKLPFDVLTFRMHDVGVKTVLDDLHLQQRRYTFKVSGRLDHKAKTLTAAFQAEDLIRSWHSSVGLHGALGHLHWDWDLTKHL
jgi:hypothetical protein